MPIFRRKPEEVDAILITTGIINDPNLQVLKNFLPLNTPMVKQGDNILITIYNGVMRITIDDYLAKKANGEYCIINKSNFDNMFIP